MVQKSTEKTKVDRFRFAVRFSGLFFPLAYGDLSKILSGAGYSLVGPLKQTPVLVSGAQIMIGGRIAEKGDSKFEVDPERGVIALEGQVVDNVLEEFQSIEKLALDLFSVDIVREARFYESMADLTTLGDKDPMVTIGNLFGSSAAASSFTKILGYEVTNFGVRLVKKGQAPNQEEWSEYRVEPLITKPTTTYYANVLYRSRNRTAVVSAAKGFVQTVEELTKAMEVL